MGKERAPSEKLMIAYRKLYRLMERVSLLGSRKQYKAFKENSIIREGSLSAIYSDFVSDKFGFEDMASRLEVYYKGLDDSLNDVDSDESEFYNNFSYPDDESTKEEFADYAERRFKSINSGLVVPKQSLIRMSASSAIMGLAVAQLLNNNLEDTIYTGLITGTIPSIVAGAYQIAGRFKSQKFWSLLEKDIDDSFGAIVDHARNIELIPHLQLAERIESERNHQCIMAWDEGDDELAKKLSSN